MQAANEPSDDAPASAMTVMARFAEPDCFVGLLFRRRFGARLGSVAMRSQERRNGRRGLLVGFRLLGLAIAALLVAFSHDRSSLLMLLGRDPPPMTAAPPVLSQRSNRRRVATSYKPDAPTAANVSQGRTAKSKVITSSHRVA